MPLKIWQIYHLVYGDQVRDSGIVGLRYHNSSKVIPSPAEQTRSSTQITLPSRALIPHLTAIVSPSFEWITCLTICDTPNYRQGWGQLAQLGNLVMLRIENWKLNFGTIDDVVVREWGRAAREGRAFSQLRMVMLRNHTAITFGALDDFAYFPRLRILHLACQTLDAKQANAKVKDKRWRWGHWSVSRGSIWVTTNRDASSPMCDSIARLWYYLNDYWDVLKIMYRRMMLWDHEFGPAPVEPADGDPPGVDDMTPLVSVRSGIVGHRDDASKLDELWFELRASKSQQHENPPAHTSDRGPKRRLRKGKEGMLKTLYADMGQLG
jgi:hypothetical protein